jgi:hypothetical protein
MKLSWGQTVLWPDRIGFKQCGQISRPSASDAFFMLDS